MLERVLKERINDTDNELRGITLLFLCDPLGRKIQQLVDYGTTQELY